MAALSRNSSKAGDNNSELWWDADDVLAEARARPAAPREPRGADGPKNGRRLSPSQDDDGLDSRHQRTSQPQSPDTSRRSSLDTSDAGSAVPDFITVGARLTLGDSLCTVRSVSPCSDLRVVTTCFLGVGVPASSADLSYACSGSSVHPPLHHFSLGVVAALSRRVRDVRVPHCCRYIGRTSFNKKGVWVGVVLDTPTGMHGGVVEGNAGYSRTREPQTRKHRYAHSLIRTSARTRTQACACVVLHSHCHSTHRWRCHSQTACLVESPQLFATCAVTRAAHPHYATTHSQWYTPVVRGKTPRTSILFVQAQAWFVRATIAAGDAPRRMPTGKLSSSSRRELADKFSSTAR